MGNIQKFGEYEILGQLSKGVGANVFLARTGAQNTVSASSQTPSKSHRLVCIKTLSQKWSQEQQLIEMFEDEGRLAEELDHPNCVDTFKFDRVSGIRFIAMEYLSGLTLKDVIRDSVLSRVEMNDKLVTSMVARACRALDYAHHLQNVDGIPYNLIHRDICPHNVMVTYSGKVKLMDFGVVKADTERLSTANGVVKGRFTYMSPEHISGGMIDRRSDIFSMGILLYEMLARKRFYENSNPRAIAKVLFQRKLAQLSSARPDCDQQLQEICNKAVQFSPRDRYQTAGEMADALEAYSDETSEVSHVPKAAELMLRIAGRDQVENAASSLDKLENSDTAPDHEELILLNPRIMNDMDPIIPDSLEMVDAPSLKIGTPPTPLLPLEQRDTKDLELDDEYEVQTNNTPQVIKTEQGQLVLSDFENSEPDKTQPSKLSENSSAQLSSSKEQDLIVPNDRSLKNTEHSPIPSMPQKLEIEPHKENETLSDLNPVTDLPQIEENQENQSDKPQSADISHAQNQGSYKHLFILAFSCLLTGGVLGFILHMLLYSSAA